MSRLWSSRMTQSWVEIAVLSSAVGQAASLPRLMTLFPTDQFGQFCGEQAMVRSGGVMMGGLLAGFYLDIVKRFFPAGDLRPYRFMYLWVVFFGLIATVFHYRAYRFWKRLGSENGTPPTKFLKYSELPLSPGREVDKKLFLVPLSGFIGIIGASVFLTGYSHFVSANALNVYVFGALSVALVIYVIAYFFFVRFMERP